MNANATPEGTMTEQTLTISTLATEAYDWFESFKRDGSDETIYRTKDGAPEWLRDLVHEAHGDMLPDDWRYEAIMDALSHIGDTDAETADDLDDESHEFADGHVDVYNAARAEWLASHLARGGYVDQAIDDGLADPSQGVYQLIGVGQYVELEEVFASVRQSLADRLEELEAETDDDES